MFNAHRIITFPITYELLTSVSNLLGSEGIKVSGRNLIISDYAYNELRSTYRLTDDQVEELLIAIITYGKQR